MAATKKPAPRRAAKFADPQARDPEDPEVTDKRATEPKSAPVVAAGPVAVHVDSGDIKVVVAPPSRDGFDRRLYRVLNDLPHTKHSDRYVSVLSDLGEGLGWVAGGIAIAILGGPKGRHSFPSGHTASSFAAATALAMFYPRAAPLAYSVATAVGMSRVHLGVHFPSDAAVGGVIGIGIGTFCGWVFKKR